MSRLNRASVLQFGIEAFQTTLGFVATVYFARLLGAGPLGQYFLALAVVNWLLIPTNGIRGAVQKRVSENEEQEEYFTAGVAVQLAVLVVLLAGLLLFRAQVNAYLGFKGTLLIGALAFVKGGGTFLRAILRGEHRVELAAVVGGTWETLRLVLQVALVVGGFRLLGLLVGEIAAAAVITLTLVVLLSLRLGRPSGRHFRSLYDYGKYSWLTTIKPFSYSWMDVLVLGFLVTESAIGVYEIAWRVSAVFILLPSAMAKVSAPYLSRQANQGETGDVAATLRTATTFAGLFAIPGVAGAFVVGGDVLGIYGEEFATGALVLGILAVGRLGQSYETFLLQSLNAIDRPDATFRISLVFIAANLALNLVLVWQFGAIGAAVATAATMLLSMMLATRVSRRIVGFEIDWTSIGVQVLSAAVMAIVVWVVRERVTPMTDVKTLLVVGFGAGVYLLCVFLGSAQARTQLNRVVDQTIDR